MPLAVDINKKQIPISRCDAQDPAVGVTGIANRYLTILDIANIETDFVFQ